jgi:hypothetical protein
VACEGGLWALVAAAAAGGADGGAALAAALAEQEWAHGALHVDDARRVLAAAVVAEQPAAAAAVLAAVVVAEMPDAPRLEKAAADVSGDTDRPRRPGVKVRPGRDADNDANLAARDAAARVIQCATRHRLPRARPRGGRGGGGARPPPRPAPRLVHVGTAFFDGVPSPNVRTRLSQLFAGGLPLERVLHIDPADVPRGKEVQEAEKVRDAARKPAQKALDELKKTRKAFDTKTKDLKRLVHQGEEAGKTEEAEREAETARVSGAKEAYDAADKAHKAVEKMEKRMREAETKCADAEAKSQRALEAAPDPSARDELEVRSHELEVRTAEHKRAEALAEWNEWRREHSADVEQPKQGGFRGMLSSIVGGGGMAGAGAAALAQPEESARLTGVALHKRAGELEKKLEVEKIKRKDAEKARVAAVAEGRRAKQELEVSGPKIVEKAEAVAREKAEALAAAEAELAAAAQVYRAPLAAPRVPPREVAAGCKLFAAAAARDAASLAPAVGRCRMTVSKPVLKAKHAWFQRMKLECDEALSNLGFNFNLRRYTALPALRREYATAALGRAMQVDYSIKTRVESASGFSA